MNLNFFKKGVMTACTAALLLSSINSWAIDHKYREALEWSGCTQQNADVTDASGKIICDSHKPKAWNKAHQPAGKDAAHIKAIAEAQRRDLETFVNARVLHQPKDAAFSALQQKGFSRENDGDFYRIQDTRVDHVYMTFNSAQEVITATIK